MVKDLGAVSAYALAVEHGYLGTEEEFAREQALFGENAKQVALDKQAVADIKTDIDKTVTKFATDKTDVENKITQFNNDSDDVKATITQFAKDATVATNAVNDAKTAAINAVNSAGDDNVVKVNNATNTALKSLDDTKASVISDIGIVGADVVKQINGAGLNEVDEIKLAGAGERASLETTGSEQSGLVAGEGVKQLDLIAKAGLAQVEAVTNEGTTQTKAVAAEGDKQLKIIMKAGGSLENTLTNYFNLRRSGKVFSTKFYKYDTSQSYKGEKLNANEGMFCEPSTDTFKGRDDYQNYGLFQHFTCNYEVDAQGFIHVLALEGDKDFKKTGPVFVGEVTCSGWVGIEDFADSFIVHYSDKKTDRTPHPMKESINPDGTINPWMVHAKYLASDIGGKPYSTAGECPANNNQLYNVNTSYNSQVVWHHKHGQQYSGLCACDMFYRQLMLFVKYATKHSQGVMQGCTGYSSQKLVSKPETGVKRVVLSTSDANGYLIGSYISVGDASDSSKAPDRYNSTCHNIAYDVKILDIEDLLDGNSALNLDLEAPITTTATTWVSTFHWRTGSTDCVLGSDGSPVSNTNGKCPCKIQGIEYSLGGYEVLGNAIMDIVTGEDGIPMRDVYVAKNAADITTDITTIRQKYAKARTQMPYTNGSWNYISELDIDAELGMMVIKEAKASGSSTGYCDGLYTDTATSGQREFLCVGVLNRRSHAGLFCVNADNGLGIAYWYYLAGVSPNGCRGEYVA